jgi:hypothetical protein
MCNSSGGKGITQFFFGCDEGQCKAHIVVEAGIIRFGIWAFFFCTTCRSHSCSIGLGGAPAYANAMFPPKETWGSLLAWDLVILLLHNISIVFLQYWVRWRTRVCKCNVPPEGNLGEPLGAFENKSGVHGRGRGGPTNTSAFSLQPAKQIVRLESASIVIRIGFAGVMTRMSEPSPGRMASLFPRGCPTNVRSRKLVGQCSCRSRVGPT